MPGKTLFIFLRAVNLGKRNKVPMKELQAAIAEWGLGRAEYLLQSGNLAFSADDAPADVPALKSELEQLVLERFAVETKAIARTDAELRGILSANPFPVSAGGTVQVSLWDEEPDEAGLEELRNRDWGADQLSVRPREAIIGYASATQNSKLNNTLIERLLKVPATSRNVRTFERLLDRFWQVGEMTVESRDQVPGS